MRLMVLILLFCGMSCKAQDMVGGFTEYHPIGPSYCYPHCDSIAYLCTFVYIVQPPYYHPDSVLMKFWNKDDSSLCAVRFQAEQSITDIPYGVIPCGVNQDSIKYKAVKYAATVDFKPNNQGYYWALQGCCRASGYVNIAAGTWGYTYYMNIPPPQLYDSSPTWNY